VHRLTLGAFTRELRGERGIGCGQPSVDVGSQAG
jgi:hypothetical protein